VDASLRALSDQIDDATQRLLAPPAMTTALREPSPARLDPRHVLTTCAAARRARNLLAGARAGQDRPPARQRAGPGDDIAQGAATVAAG
jgi:hypothetical protein